MGCTELDDIDYSEKLARIFLRNEIKSIYGCTYGSSVLCGNGACGENGAEREREQIPVKTVVISTEGEILQEPAKRSKGQGLKVSCVLHGNSVKNKEKTSVPKKIRSR
ncbi:MAG: hypothetical protein ACLRIL_09315 [Fusicatenibacter saccharivorans]